MSPTPATASFLAARDILLTERENGPAARERFSWPDVGPHFNWAVDWFDAIALGNDSTALWIVEEDGLETKVTFREMSRRSDRVANWMRERGVRQSDRVMLMLGNQVELWESMLAIMKLGAVILPTSTVLGPDELADRIERADVAHVVANAADAPRFESVRQGVGRIAIGGPVEGWAHYGESASASDERPGTTVGSDDPALIYFTSGTTSKPKMVVHTHSSYPVGHLSTLAWLGLQPGDVHLAISSPGWGKHAWSCFFAPWIAEATVFVYNYARFDAKALVAQLDRAHVTTFCAPPTVWRMLIQSDITTRPGALREILSAGEPLNPEVISRIRSGWGLVIRDGYGQTETTAIIANQPGAQLVPGSMGTPLPGVTIALLDPITGEPGDEGEICVDLSGAPVNVMAGYLGDDAKTATATANGFFHTGDVASRDDQGYITFIGRTDDIFKSSDFKVSPFEVESILLEHDAVAEAAVVGAPDDIRLNITKAYVALADGWAPDEQTARQILHHATEAMPPYMRVRRLEFFDLPKTASGKIRRVELREREVAAARDGERFPDEWR